MFKKYNEIAQKGLEQKWGHCRLQVLRRLAYNDKSCKSLNKNIN